jgi:hypothetical protein
MIQTHSSELVLAIRPFTRGVAFVFAEGPLSPIDWGVTEIKGGKWNARCAAAARALIDHLKPDVVALPIETSSTGGLSGRAKRLLKLIGNHALGQSIDVVRYSRANVQACFENTGALTRYEIAQAIASQIPAFAHRLPPVRRTWDREAPRLYLFDAAALAMTYYASPPANH